MRRTTISLLAAAVLMLAGCSPFGSGSGTPSAPSPSASAGAAADAEQIATCTKAIVAAKNDTADNGLPECAKLSPDDYLKAIEDAKKQGGDR
ncbi:hypothetical protein [Streptomyces sp. Ru72]|uniref:hypothetical protein n=1 Tax=Streptomyces sp. Ru72 TaxID=2080747 RepID=UPI000CDD1FE8|nr:hypothetical protein [Streptomyces sp. Ru72]POX45452.1 hypothetical protein C3488_29750 [Streptomyces sp. Ru72]